MSTGQGSPRPSAAVYRRRRIVVGIAALLVIALLIWGVSAIVGAIRGPGPDKTAAPAPEPSQSSSAAPASSSGAPAGVNPDGSCPAGAVKVTASTDKASYASGAKPVLIMTLRNTLSVPCTTNVGTKEQEFVVTSGTDRIFSTKDCQKDAVDTQFQLEPGKDEQARFTWNRARSLTKCAAIDAKPRPGMYTLQVMLGKAESEKVQFALK